MSHETDSEIDTKNDSKNSIIDSKKDTKDIVNTVNTEEMHAFSDFTLECPMEDCDWKTEPKVSIQKAWYSVRSHYNRLHGHEYGKLELEQVGLTEADISAPSKDKDIPGVTPEKRKKTTRITVQKKQKEELLSRVPSAYELLLGQLLLYRLPNKDAVAVCDYMSSYDPDDILVLNKSLRDVGMKSNLKKMFLESWIKARGLDVGWEVEEELELFREPRDMRQYDTYGRKIRSRKDTYGKDDEEREIDRRIKKAQQEGVNLGTLVTEMSHLKESMNTSYEPEFDPEKEALLAENARLKEEQQFNKFKEYIDSKFDKMGGEKDALTTGIKEVSGLFKEYLSMVGGIMGATQQMTPKPKSHGPEGITAIIEANAPELLED